MTIFDDIPDARREVKAAQTAAALFRAERKGREWSDEEAAEDRRLREAEAEAINRLSDLESRSKQGRSTD